MACECKLKALLSRPFRVENRDEDAIHPLVTERLALEKLRSDRNLQEGDHGDGEIDDGYSEADRKLVEESDLMYRAHMVLEDRWMSNVLDIIIAVNCGVMGQDQVMI
jgi:hypothetical protein